MIFSSPRLELNLDALLNQNVKSKSVGQQHPRNQRELLSGVR